MQDKLWNGSIYAFWIIFVSLLFYVLATSKVLSWWVLTSDSAHLWWLYSTGPLGNQATRTMTWYPSQSHYPDTEPTGPSNVECLDRKRQVSILETGSEPMKFGFPNLPKRETDAFVIRPCGRFWIVWWLWDSAILWVLWFRKCDTFNKVCSFKYCKCLLPLSYRDGYMTINLASHMKLQGMTILWVGGLGVYWLSRGHFNHKQIVFPRPAAPCPILVIHSARLGSSKYNFSSHWFDSAWVQVWDLTSIIVTQEVAAQLILWIGNGVLSYHAVWKVS